MLLFSIKDVIYEYIQDICSNSSNEKVKYIDTESPIIEKFINKRIELEKKWAEYSGFEYVENPNILYSALEDFYINKRTFKRTVDRYIEDITNILRDYTRKYKIELYEISENRYVFSEKIKNKLLNELKTKDKYKYYEVEIINLMTNTDFEQCITIVDDYDNSALGKAHKNLCSQLKNEKDDETKKNIKSKINELFKNVYIRKERIIVNKYNNRYKKYLSIFVKALSDFVMHENIKNMDSLQVTEKEYFDTQVEFQNYLCLASIELEYYKANANVKDEIYGIAHYIAYDIEPQTGSEDDALNITYKEFTNCSKWFLRLIGEYIKMADLNDKDKLQILAYEENPIICILVLNQFYTLRYAGKVIYKLFLRNITYHQEKKNKKIHLFNLKEYSQKKLGNKKLLLLDDEKIALHMDIEFPKTINISKELHEFNRRIKQIDSTYIIYTRLNHLMNQMSYVNCEMNKESIGREQIREIIKTRYTTILIRKDEILKLYCNFNYKQREKYEIKYFKI